MNDSTTVINTAELNASEQMSKTNELGSGDGGGGAEVFQRESG